MIDKYNIPIHSKNTKKIKYFLFLDSGEWEKEEFNHKDKPTYFESSRGKWYKAEYDSWGSMIYYESSYGYIIDDR